MKISISHTQQDKKYAEIISRTLRDAGHDVWYDSWKLRIGDNFVEKTVEGLKAVDVYILIVSKYSMGSPLIMHKFSALAFGELSSQTNRIIPVLVDKISLPEYLAHSFYVDLTDNLEYGIDKIVKGLNAPLSERPRRRTDRKRTYETAIKALSQALHAGRMTLVCGAGISIAAGIPSWNELLLRLLESMMSKISKDYSISLEDVDPQEFQKRYGPSALVVGKYLKSNLGKDFMSELRDALYSEDPTSCMIIEAISELARPQRDGKPLDSIVTFNFDGLIEEALFKNNIRHKTIHEEGVRNAPNELPVYHVHGYLPRKGKIKRDTDIVFSEDAYHSQFIDPFSWSNLTQLNKLSQNTCLFLGLSLTDPNLRRLLDVAYRKNPSRTLNHYIIKKVPSFSGKNDTVDDLALLLEEQDANELGLNVIWIESFDEIAPLLMKIPESHA